MGNSLMLLEVTVPPTSTFDVLHKHNRLVIIYGSTEGCRKFPGNLFRLNDTFTHFFVVTISVNKLRHLYEWKSTKFQCYLSSLYPYFVEFGCDNKQGKSEKR